MDDSRFNRSILLDFYGELLTQKQRECYDLHYNEDLSLSEIAEQLGVSRQGVWDNIRRADAAMTDIEEKTGLIRRTEELRQGLDRLRLQLAELCAMTDGQAKHLAETAAAEVDELIRG